MTRFAIPRGFRGVLGIASLVILGACAAQETDTTSVACQNPKSVACSHTGGTSSTTGGAGNAAGGTAMAGTDSGIAGSTSSIGGTGGTGDPNGNAGTTSTLGGASGTTAIGGAAGTVAMAGGTGGAPAGGTGGTSAHGGGGGTSTAGTTGAGGATNAACTTPIPARSSWVGTASSFSNACATPTNGLCNPPAYAFDDDTKSRFSTGAPQMGTEWLQLDFTTKGTVDQVTVSVSNGDFGRHLQIRMSDTDKDTAAPVLAEMDGVTGTMVFMFAPKTARYVLISQTKPLATGETSWWSVQDVTATCQ